MTDDRPDPSSGPPPDPNTDAGLVEEVAGWLPSESPGQQEWMTGGRVGALFSLASDRVAVRRAVPTMMGIRIAGIGLSFVLSIVVARVLGPYDKGIYGLLVLMPVLASTLLDFGVTNGNFFYLSRNELSPETAYANTLAHILVTFAVVALPLALFGRGLLGSVFPGVPSSWLIVSLLALGPLWMHGFMVDGLMLGTDRAVATYVLPFFRQCLTFAGVLIVLLIGGRVRWILVVTIVAALVTQVVYFAAFHRGRRPTALAKPRLLLRSARFGSPLYIATLLSLLHSRADQLLVANALSPSGLGQYALAVAVGEMLWSIDLPVIASLQHRVASATGDDAADLVRRSTRLILITMSCACLLAGATAHWLIPFVYGRAYRPAVAALIAYLPGVLAWSLARSVGQDIGYQRKRPDLVLYTNACSLGLNLVLLGVLLRPMGIVGAALASSASYFVLLVLSAIVHSRLSGRPLFEPFLPGRDDFAWLAKTARDYFSAAVRRFPRP